MVIAEPAFAQDGDIDDTTAVVPPPVLPTTIQPTGEAWTLTPELVGTMFADVHDVVAPLSWNDCAKALEPSNNVQKHAITKRNT
jgi:hypothetical protein